MNGQSPDGEGWKYCPRCGEELLRIGSYCHDCGYRIDGFTWSCVVTPPSLVTPNHIGTRKWKAITLTLLVLNIVLIGAVYSYHITPLNVEYYELKGQYAELESDYSSLSEWMERTETWYESIREEVNQRQGLGERRQRFITPYDASVGDLVVEVTNGWHDHSNWEEYWSDVKSMYDWVVVNVYYSYDSPSPYMSEILEPLVWQEEVYRFPNETISSECGDCEDQASLLASMILNYGNRGYIVWVIRFESETGAHHAVALLVEGGRLSILDPTGEFYTRALDGRLTSKNIHEAINEWIRDWSDQGLRNLQVTEIYSETEFEVFDDTEEFINWAYNR